MTGTQTLVALAAVQQLRRERRARTEDTRALREALTPEAIAALIKAAVAADPARFAGKPGRTPTAAEIGAAVAAYLEPRLEVLRGPAPDAAQLTALIDDVIRADPERFRGRPGDPGRGIAALRINHAGHLVVTWTDGTTANLGRVVGKDAEGRKRDRIFVTGGGISEARALELIEAAMSPPDVEYLRIVTTVTAAGPTTLHTPAAGKALRIRRVKCTPDPDATDTPMLTLRVGDKLIQRGPVLYGADFVTGAPGDPLILELESAAAIGVTILYEEVDP